MLDKSLSFLYQFSIAGKFCFKGDCYVVNLTLHNHIGSVDFCKNIGYNLAKISNELEHNYLMDIIRQSSDDNAEGGCYIGKYLASLSMAVTGTLIGRGGGCIHIEIDQFEKEPVGTV